jgi:hypothetical protein
MTDTQDISNDLSAWIDGELPGARAKQVAEAVQADPALAAEADELRQVASLISQFGAPELPDDFAQRIVEQAIQPKPSHFPRWASFCVAASVLVTTGIALLLFEDGEAPQSSLAYHSEEDAESDDLTVLDAEATDFGGVELNTEADAIRLRRRKPSSNFFGTAEADRKLDVAEEHLAKRSSGSDALKVREELDGIRPAKPIIPAKGLAGKNKACKKLPEIAADDAIHDAPEINAPAERMGKVRTKAEGARELSLKDETLVTISPVVTKPKAAGRVSKKSVEYDRVQARGKGSRKTSRAGPGRYDAVSNFAQARDEAQATITEMQNAAAVSQTVPGGPPGQKAIRLDTFQMRQRTQPENLEQTETVYAKSQEAGQQRIERLLLRNNIELVEQNQPLLNAGQAVAVSDNTAPPPVTLKQKLNSSRFKINSKTTTHAAPAASQVQYMVFGGQSQIKTLRSQIQVLNGTNEKVKVNEVASNRIAPMKQQKLLSSLIPQDIEQVQAPTQVASQTEQPAKISPPPALKTQPAGDTQRETLRQISTPAVDILIITVEERK